MKRGFELELDDRDPLQRHMASEREYEPEVSWIYPYLLRTGAAFVDGGAHIGYLTLLGASCVGTGGSVHSFEPVPATYAALARNVAHNHAANVRLNQVALGPNAGTLDLELPIDPQGDAILAWGATAIQAGRGAIERVPMITLDEYAETAKLRSIRVLKLDLEGAELGALAGARELLRRKRVDHLIVELNTYLLDLVGERYDERRALLASYGYRCWQLTKSGRVVARQDRVNRLVTRMLEVLDQRSAPQIDRRLVAVEEQLRASQSAEQVRGLELTALAQSLGLRDELEAVDLAPLAPSFSGATDVIVFGSAALARSLGAKLIVDGQQPAEGHF